jgi:hypothetical protein
MILQMNSDYFPVQHSLIGLSNGKTLRSVCGTNQIFPRRLVAGLSHRRPVFDSGSVHVRCVVDKVSTRTGLPPNNFIFRCQYHSTGATNSMLIVPLSEGQAGEAWESSNEVLLFRISRSIRQKFTFTLPFVEVFNGFSALPRIPPCLQIAGPDFY